ncbi:P-loop containing nucleoside triphosphate hydrolase protein [Nadsonia fulvescens var. elongata DSM 6958]|uniref:p-loop containing nucleoside triphosphate hydrolase protein n=1 Tax=Nadsonia fulvescens var. elongata DSM 6958 TaxID=857566 RepID=A0A1E3PHE5_9ASCO|nr:P-loop containing nucleoside triphosphate hydrolase protein [Nadsonia fulvescens var. elongata DSM 6958]
MGKRDTKTPPKKEDPKTDSKGKSKKVSKTEESLLPLQKKPTNRQIVASSGSWTGKLPSTLLHEHCQKLKWGRVEYEMKHTKEGFIAHPVLQHINPQTKETTTITYRPSFTGPFSVPPAETALEARHFGSTFALHRIASHKNLSMVLPGEHKTLWNKWEKARKDGLKDKTVNSDQFVADPFVAKWDKDKNEAAEKKRREKEAEAAQRSQKPEIVLSIMKPSTTKKVKDDKEKKSSSRLDSEPKDSLNHLVSTAPVKPFTNQHKIKPWDNAPIVKMSREMRSCVEELIKKNHKWQHAAHKLSVDKESSAGFKKVNRLLIDLGFRASHVEEALEWCADDVILQLKTYPDDPLFFKEACASPLSWLLVHLPEGDLPQIFQPDPTLVSSTTLTTAEPLIKTYMVERLVLKGFSEAVVRSVMAQVEKLQGPILDIDDLERLVASKLTLGLIEDIENDEEFLVSVEEDVMGLEIWNEEMGALEAIYSGKVESSSTKFTVTLSPHSFPAESLSLTVYRPSNYPNNIPSIFVDTIKANTKIPSYIKLALIQQAAEYTWGHLKGDSMIYSIVEWVEENIARIFDSPGKLVDVAGGVTGVCETPKHINKKNRNIKKRGSPFGGYFSQSEKEERSKTLLQAHQENISRVKTMIASRQKLPAWGKQVEILKAIDVSRVVLVTGETGSGKSTQVVQFVLDSLTEKSLGATVNIICTQPRRISAMGLADRVSEERGFKVGQEVGYVIRGENNTSKDTRLRFVTTGVLLRMIQMNPEALSEISHVFVDEVHERSLDSDFLLIILKRLLKKVKNLKVVLMSATVDKDLFINYFGGPKLVQHIHIEGRTFPVDDYYLDDVIRYTKFQLNGSNNGDEIDVGTVIRSLNDSINYDLIASTVKFIDSQLGKTEGGILIFLPGIAEISRTISAINSLSESYSLYVLPLHASLNPQDQRKVFPSAPKSKRKIVVSTNVAETSITIPDIVAVIDTGRVKETVYDPRANMVKLVDTWASAAACRQRRGRAGRVQKGICYKLFTKNAEETKMPKSQQPEMLRTPLEQLYLSVKSMESSDDHNNIDAAAFLGEAIDPPAALAVSAARRSLESIGALNPITQSLTALGRHVAQIPADIKCAKLLVYGVIFSCIEACVTVASILSSRSPFVNPSNSDNGKDNKTQANTAKLAFSQGHGDLMAAMRAYDEWTSIRKSKGSAYTRHWCEDNFVSMATMFDITSTRTQLLDSLHEINFLPRGYKSRDGDNSSYNENNNSDALIRALIAAAMTPNIARIQFPQKKYMDTAGGAMERDPESRAIKFFAQTDEAEENKTNENVDNKESSNHHSITSRVFIHPSSTLFSASKFPQHAEFVSFFSKMATSKTFIRDVTPMGNFSLLLFGSGQVKADLNGRGVSVEWVRLKCWVRIGVLVEKLRNLLDDVLSERLENPSQVTDNQKEIIKVVQDLIEKEGY